MGNETIPSDCILRTAVTYPKFFRLRQTFERPRVDNVANAVALALESLDLARVIRPGHTVVLTAGSRGIANIPVVLRR